MAGPGPFGGGAGRGPPGHGPPGPRNPFGQGTRSCIFGPGTAFPGERDLESNLGIGPARARSTPATNFGRADGVNDPLGIGQLGRSDLDPLGRIGTGMVADPRGLGNMRNPQGLPPGHPQGARFDPFGPVAPQPPFFGSQQPPPGPFPPMGPTPDHLHPVPFPGEEPRQPGQPPRRGQPPHFGGPDPDNEQRPTGAGYDDMFM